MDAFYFGLIPLIFVVCEVGVGLLCHHRFGWRGIFGGRGLIYPLLAAPPISPAPRLLGLPPSHRS